MNFSKLLYESHEYKNNSKIYDYEFDQFVNVVLEANITFMKYLKDINIPYFYSEKHETYDYITFDMNELISDNELFQKYGIIITNEKRQVLHRIDNKHYDDIDVTHVKFPIHLLLDFNISKNKWKSLEKTM